MIDTVFRIAKSDIRLAALLDEAREYAQIYVLAKQRHKGCEGTGELMTLREELRDTIGKLVKYCGEKGYPCGVKADDPDAAALELTRLRIVKTGMR
jgi:hypothetical protein